MSGWCKLRSCTKFFLIILKQAPHSFNQVQLFFLRAAFKGNFSSISGVLSREAFIQINTVCHGAFISFVHGPKVSTK